MNLQDLPLGLSYDDVLIVPLRSSVRTRKDVNLNTQLTRSIPLEIPIVAAPMDSVCESRMAIAMAQLGGCGIIHRFQPPEEQAEEVQKVKAAGKSSEADLPVGFAVGTENDMDERAKVCVDAGADILVVDIAHGHSDHAIEATQKLKQAYPDIGIVVGNIATAQGAIDLAGAGADCLRVGVGPGGVCTTREVTGVGVPQFSAIKNIVSAAVGIPIMADGGIRTSGDIAKALAAGADTVMIGSLLAGTMESPGKLEQTNRGLIKLLRGMASHEAAKIRAERHGEELDDEYFEHRSPEGVEGAVPYKGEAAKVIKQLMGGVKSSLSYVGATDLLAFRENVQFVRVTPAGLVEGKPHATL